jgi:4-hydroxythreonine-4-phosphate dehydrogenase
LAGLSYRDHTEYLRELAPWSDAQMVLAAPAQKLWCVLATRHVSFNRVIATLDAGAIIGAAAALDRALRRLGFSRPRIALCALNPHAGEDGLLGPEERRLLAPAARRAKLRGPIAADTAWRWHKEGRLDGLVCLYHDQALIPLKTAGGLGIVNWTAGLPFMRTSPGHGTGYDIAGKGKASAEATIEAALLAARLAGKN